VLVDRALHLHGRVDEPEGDASRPDRAGHVRPILKDSGRRNELLAGGAPDRPQSSPGEGNRGRHAGPAGVASPSLGASLSVTEVVPGSVPTCASIPRTPRSPISSRSSQRCSSSRTGAPLRFARTGGRRSSSARGRHRSRRSSGADASMSSGESGLGSRQKLRELVESGGIAELRALEEALELGLVAYGRVLGLTASRMLRIARELDVRTVADFDEAVANGRLREVSGIGAVTESKILSALAREPMAPRGLTLRRSRPLAQAIATLSTETSRAEAGSRTRPRRRVTAATPSSARSTSSWRAPVSARTRS